MNVLEKILEEIENYTLNVYECDLDNIIEYQREHGEDKTSYIVQGIYEAVEFIRSHMDEIENNDWISVDERLPEEKTEVLCCFEDGTVQSLWQNWKNSGFSGYLDNGLKPTKVTAWRSFPEPYKPKKDKTAAGKEHIMSRFMKVE